MLRDCPDRLDADLRRVYPGTSLDDYWEGRVRPSALANMAVHLPRGSAVWQYYGGQLAITAETEAAWLIERATFAVASKEPDKVKPRPYPLGVEALQRQQEYTTSQAEAWRRKQAQRAAGQHG